MTNLLADVQMHATKAAFAPTKTLVTSGIFRLARSPNYLGDWMRYGSFCVISGRIYSFVLLAALIAFNLGQLKDPESKGIMPEKYGKQFTDWTMSTPSEFIPIPDAATQKAMMTIAGVWTLAYLIPRLLTSKPKKVEG